MYGKIDILENEKIKIKIKKIYIRGSKDREHQLCYTQQNGKRGRTEWAD